MRGIIEIPKEESEAINLVIKAILRVLAWVTEGELGKGKEIFG